MNNINYHQSQHANVNNSQTQQTIGNHQNQQINGNHSNHQTHGNQINQTNTGNNQFKNENTQGSHSNYYNYLMTESPNLSPNHHDKNSIQQSQQYVPVSNNNNSNYKVNSKIPLQNSNLLMNN